MNWPMPVLTDPRQSVSLRFPTGCIIAITIAGTPRSKVVRLRSIHLGGALGALLARSVRKAERSTLVFKGVDDALRTVLGAHEYDPYPEAVDGVRLWLAVAAAIRACTVALVFGTEWIRRQGKPLWLHLASNNCALGPCGALFCSSRCRWV